MSNGDPWEVSVGRSFRRQGFAVTHRGRILRILVCNRVDLGVSTSDVEVCLQEGLDVGVIALRTGLESNIKVIACEGTHMIDWLQREKSLQT